MWWIVQCSYCTVAQCHERPELHKCESESFKVALQMAGFVESMQPFVQIVWLRYGF